MGAEKEVGVRRFFQPSAGLGCPHQFGHLWPEPVILKNVGQLLEEPRVSTYLPEPTLGEEECVSLCGCCH